MADLGCLRGIVLLMNIIICSIFNAGIDLLFKFATLIVALLGLLKAFCEYEDHLKRQKTQYLLDFGKKYTEDKEIKEVVHFLEKLEDDNMYCSEKMKENMTYTEDAINIHSIEMYMRFIEELELLIRSGSVTESAALNLFGYYTTILDKYNSRWPTLNYGEKYWNVYRSFVKRVKKFNYNNVSL